MKVYFGVNLSQTNVTKTSQNKNNNNEEGKTNNKYENCIFLCLINLF